MAYFKIGRESYHYQVPDSSVRLGERQVHALHTQIHHKQKKDRNLKFQSFSNKNDIL